MTPTTLIIDKKYAGVGRIKRASGTTDPRVRARYVKTLDALANAGRVDLLRAIRDGQLTFAEVHDAYQRNALHALPLGATAANLGTAMQAWIDTLTTDGPSPDYSAKHVISLGQSRKYLQAAAPKATVADLPAVLEKLRASLGAQHPRSFNLVRAAALAFVKKTLKKSHPLWLQVAAVELRKVQAQREPHPLTPDEARTHFPAPATDPVDAIAWGMMTTGMGQGEYWGRWATMPDRVRIYGTKRSGRVRDVPLVRAPAPPSMHHRTFENKVRDRAAGRFTVYDLRRTYANWMERAGVERTRRRLYMGHGERDMTDLYERHQVDPHLVPDARLIQQHIGGDDAPPLRLVKGS